MHFPVVLRFEVRYLFPPRATTIAESRRLHAANGGKEETAIFELNAVSARVPLMPTSQSASDRLRAAASVASFQRLISAL